MANQMKIYRTPVLLNQEPFNFKKCVTYSIFDRSRAWRLSMPFSDIRICNSQVTSMKTLLDYKRLYSLSSIRLLQEPYC